jgi:putative tricarboxylic transport membrane protein
MSEPSEHREGGAVGTRWPELAIAAFLLLLAGLVITDSLRTGIGWADDGPQSGYFPFRVGLLLRGASLWTLAAQLLRWKRADPVFAQRAQLVMVVQVLVPIVVYVALIAVLGIYVASALLIGYFMRRHGRYGALPTLLVSLGVPLVFFLVFERWFLVPLLKGPLERLLGY